MPETRIKARRFRIFRLSTFDCLTEKEHSLYNAWKKCSKKEDKKNLREEYDNKIKLNKDIRKVPDGCIYCKDKDGKITDNHREDKQIALFENEMARIANTFETTFPLVEEIVFMMCEDESIMWQIICNGVLIHNTKYLVYSSSTNQQKKKIITLLKESFFLANEERIMCGLTIDKINKGNNRISGCNRGKFLAYTSLIMSSSVAYFTDSIDNNVHSIEINIDDCILVNDFETEITEKVTYLDTNTLKTEVKEMPVPIKHMDGAGIFLPELLPASCQIRGGWLKGAMFPFDFLKFINNKENAKCEIIDAYGDNQDIIKQNIKAIFTTSQLKMWKYYDNWEDYKENFKKSGCKIVVNNIAHMPKENSVVRITYQFLQTLPRENLTNEAIERLCKKTLDYVLGGRKDIDIALQMMGVENDKQALEPLQAAIKMHKGMLADNYVKSRLKDVLASERKRACGGKIIVDGFYAYICPDLYAFCEWLFCNEKTPKGLIPKYHVYNSYYNEKNNILEVDCLRSPHLGDSEHCIRTLIKSDECKEWFIGTDTVISTHDLITKHLQNDSDGDEMLITSSRELIDLISRDNPPLYYEMGNGKDELITNDAIFNCLCDSFKNNSVGGISIGDISNVLTKEWNSDNPDIDFIRVMTAFNNFVIDYPKTQFLISLGQYQEKYEYLRDKVLPPHFFVDAKKKKARACADENSSNVNRIWSYMHKKTSNAECESINNISDDLVFNPELLKDRTINVDIKSDRYSKLLDKMYVLKYRARGIENAAKKAKIELCNEVNDFDATHLKYDLFYHYCRKAILDIFKENGKENEKKAVTYLVHVEYLQAENAFNSKNILWNCFGNILIDNLKENIKYDGDIPVKKCIYSSFVKDKERIQEAIEKQLNRENDVFISKSEYDYITHLNYRANSKTDRLLLFILLVLSKRYGNPFRLTLFKKYGGITQNTIDNWVGSDICKKGLGRLQKLGVLNYCIADSKRHITIKISDWDLRSEEDTQFCIVKKGNPLISLYEKTEERKVNFCEICGNKFPDDGSTTCSAQCKKTLEKRNMAS